MFEHDNYDCLDDLLNICLIRMKVIKTMLESKLFKFTNIAFIP